MRTLRLMRLGAWHSAPPPHPHPLHAWLTDRGSLTARLMLEVPQFNLVRIQQRLQPPNHDERRELKVRMHEYAVVREVLLRDGTTPLVFAHSVVARANLQHAWRGLSRLGSQPLGAMLFQDPTVSRLPMEYKKMDARHPLYRRAAAIAPVVTQTLWARRSVFIKQGRALLVTEVFLGLPSAEALRIE